MNMIPQVAEAIFGGVWKLLLNTDFPGIGASIGGVVLSLVFIRFSIRLVGFFTGFRSGGSVGRAADAAERAKSRYDRKTKQSD